MATTYSDLLARARARTKAVSVELLHERLTSGGRLSLTDVAEPDEAANGPLPGAVCVPSGLLALEVELRRPDKAAPGVVDCAAAGRAGATLADPAYLRVAIATPGFERCVEVGCPTEMDARLTTSPRGSYARHRAPPKVGEDGQVRLLASRLLALGAGGLGSRAAIYLAAAGYRANDATVRREIPFVHGSVSRFDHRATCGARRELRAVIHG